MARELKVTLTLVVDDLPLAEREEIAAAADHGPDSLPSLADYVEDADGAREITRVLESIGAKGVNDILFEGEDIFVCFAEARVSDATWGDEVKAPL